MWEKFEKGSELGGSRVWLCPSQVMFPSVKTLIFGYRIFIGNHGAYLYVYLYMIIKNALDLDICLYGVESRMAIMSSRPDI